MRVAVVIVNFGQWELTEKCIDSVIRSEGVETTITLVDNRSPGEVPEWATGRDDLRFSRQDSNTGFAGGNNRGFDLSLADEAEFTFFLNNDAEVHPWTILTLAEFLRDTPEAGIAAPAIYYSSELERIWSAGGTFQPWKMRFDQKRYAVSGDLPEEPLKVDFCSGCAMMVRTDLFRMLKGFREDFFMYYEDAELCNRMQQRGPSVWLVPSAAVIHHVAAGSGGELSPLAVYFSSRNRLVLSRLMLSVPMRIVFMTYISAVLIVKTFKFLLWQGPGLIPWIWRGYFSGLAGRTGYTGVLTRMNR